MNRRVRLTVRLGRTFARLGTELLGSKPRIVTAMKVQVAIKFAVANGRPAATTNRIHFVDALPGKFEAVDAGDFLDSTVKPTLNRSEPKGPTVILLEYDAPRHHEIDK